MASRRNVAIYTYDPDSEGGEELGKAIGKQINGDVQWLTSSTRGTIQCSHLICWGNVKEPPFILKGISLLNQPKILNKWGTGIKANKLKAFKIMKSRGVRTVPWTTNYEQAQQWLNADHIVFERTSLHGDNSKGITVLEAKQKTVLGNRAKPPKAHEGVPLFTQFVPHTAEYRIHCTQQHFFDGMEKRRGKDSKPYIFDAEHGLFCRDGVIIPMDAKMQALKALLAVGLDFGAVDLIWCAKERKTYVLEVNSAPGLLGSEAREYARGFISHGYL